MSDYHDLDTPALLVDLDRLEANIERIARIVGDGQKALRPHIKTHKCVRIAALQRAAGAEGIAVAKLGEAEVMADAGFDDILIANCVIGPTKIDRLLALATRIRVAVGVDSADGVLALSEAADRSAGPLSVLIEVDTGHGRAGVRTPADAGVLARAMATQKRIVLGGLFTHEGHVYRATAAQVGTVCRDAADRLRAAAEAVERETGEPGALSVGSTPGVGTMADERRITEIRAGNYVFYDATQVRLGADASWCALTVLATVISRPSATEALLDSGSKALSGDRHPSIGHGHVLGDAAAIVDWCSEEHGHLHLGLTRLRPLVGDKLRIVPTHACTCVNMHDWLRPIRGERAEDAWPVDARGRMV